MAWRRKLLLAAGKRRACFAKGEIAKPGAYRYLEYLGKAAIPAMQQRVVALDGLRAVAVMIVIIGHLAPTYLPGGGLGVDIFFALSGYLITSILVGEYRSRGDISFKHFYLRRTARLMPALALLLLAASLVILIGPRPFYEWKEIFYAGLYIMNWVRALGLGDSAFLAHTWSLAVEEQFYLLWPPILLL